MDKTKFYLDLSKCTEEEIKSLPQILEKAGETLGGLTDLEGDDLSYWTNFHKPDYATYWTCGTSTSTPEKTELAYPEFIKLFEGGENKEVLQVENIKDIAHTEGVLIGLKICKEMWGQGTISHENIQEEIYYYQEELDYLNSK